MSVEALRAEIAPIFEPVADNLDQLNVLNSKTDADFIGDDGNLDPKKRLANRGDIKATQAHYEAALVDSLGALGAAEALGVTDFQKSVIYGTLYHDLTFYSRNGQERPESFDSVLGLAESRLSKLNEVLEGWSNPAAYLIETRKDAVSIFRSRGLGNVCLDGEYSTSRFSVNSFPAIYAGFEGGYKVSRDPYDDMALNAEPAEGLKVGIYGYVNRYHAELEDFEKQTASGRLLFADSGEHIEIEGSEQRFALRAAMNLMSRAEADLPDMPQVDLPDPEFADELVNDLTTKLVASFGPDTHYLAEELVDNRYTKVVESKDHLRGLTFTALDAYLKAAGVTLEHFDLRIGVELDVLKESGSIRDYLTYLKTKDIAAAFLEELGATQPS